MADRRRRSSPAQSRSSRSKKHDSRRSTYEEIVPEPIQYPQQQQTMPSQYQQQRSYEPSADMRSFGTKDAERERERAAAFPSSYSSSSSESYIDISRSFPPNRSGIRTFFTAPSEHRRKLRRRRSSRLFKNGNSSSSSVNSDLAYGTGFIRRPKSRVRSRKGKEIDRERYAERERYGYDSRFSDRERERERTNATTTTTYKVEGKDGRSTLKKAATDAEILAIGAGLAKLARDQNKLDMKAAASGRKPEVFTPRDSGYGQSSSRGLGPSKISHGSDTFDEDGWESASDDESDASVDSRLAYDNNSKSRWSFFGRKKFKPLSRKNTIVDPRLFGPANSLYGIVSQPVGFGEVSSWTSVSDFGQHAGYSSTPGPPESARTSQQSLQQVYPVPTSNPEVFGAGRDSRNMSVIPSSDPPPYSSTRPGPIPLQQPQPITPVSQSVYEPIYTRTESGGILKSTNSTSRTPSLAQAALVGVAGAAVGAAIASNRDDKKERQRDEELRDRERQRRRESERAEAARETERREAEKRDSERRDKEKRELERRDAERRETERRESEKRDLERRELERRDLEKRELERKESERRRGKRSSPDRKDKSRDKDRKTDSDRDSKKREKRRDETRDERDERRERRREERRIERGSVIDDRVDVRPTEERRVERPELVDRRTKSEAAMSSTSVDPFQYQVDGNAFPTPVTESPVVHHTPTVVTVEREPDFSRMKSYSVKDSHSGSDARIEVEYSDKNDRDKRYHEAEEIYEETKHFTAPIAVAAIGAAIAAEHHRESRSDKRRDERRSGSRSDYDSYDQKFRGREPERDREAERIQEEADRAYREIIMARKIASQVIRSRTPSPDRSVVDKHKDKDEEEIVRIVTPPGMEDHKKTGPYDAPNADFQLDHVIEPREMHIFRPKPLYSRNAPEPNFLKRDPDAERPRPLLNLVQPTPTPSPVPEKQKERSESARSPVVKSPAREKPKVNTSDVVIGPRGNVIASPTTSTVSKGVTWGKNETKHFEVESPQDHRDEFVSAADLPSREVPQEIKSSGSKSKGWGAIAAGIMGAGIGATAANASDTSKSSKTKKDDDAKPYEYRGVVVEPESPPRRKSPPRREKPPSPPSPGPKPTSPRSSHIPGAFDDDLDFTATVAAGLQDTGFDPEIVINDPTFRRRDSPPGSNGPSLYHPPFAETVSDLGTIPSSAVGSTGSGFVLGEVPSTPKDWQSVSPPAEDEPPVKLSKKEQKKRDKQRRQSGDDTAFAREETSIAKEVVEEPTDYFVEPKLSKKEQKKRDKEAAREAVLAEAATPTVTEQIVESPEDLEVSKKSKKSKRTSTSPDDMTETSRDAPRVSVPIDAFDYLTKNGDDEWSDTKSKKKKRNSERYESPPRSAPIYGAASEIGETSRSKRDSERYESPPRSRDAVSDVGRSSSSKSKSKRDSERYDSPPRSRDVVSDVGRSSSSKDKSTRDIERYDSPSRSRDAYSDVGRSSSSKDKSKRDSGSYESPSRSRDAYSDVGKSSSSKEKSKRRSEYERDPEEISLPPSTPSETSRDGDYDERYSRKSSNRDSGIFNSADRDMSQSVVSADASRYDDFEPRRKKKSRSGRDDFDDTRSVASAPAGDDYDDSKKSSKKKDKDKKSGLFSSIFGSKADVSTRDESPKNVKDEDDKKKSKKSKRHSMPDSSSIYGGIGADSVGDLSRFASNGSNGKHHLEDDLDDGVRSDGERRRKSRSRSGSTTSTKKDSFLGNAGILGAGVGIAGAAAVAIAAQQQHQQSKAANTNNKTAEHIRSMGPERHVARDEIYDPEIAERQFRPSIDPQYGDLLPLPPSGPASPVESTEELPELPDSRPNTPPDAERISREKAVSAVRRNLHETPMKSPSQSAIPLKFKMGNRSTPSSPGVARSSPSHSPSNSLSSNAESLWPSKVRPARPTSWDKSTEYQPLWLPEVTRRSSTTQLQEPEDTYPELPASETTSRSSSLLDFHDAVEHPQSKTRNRSESLSIDTKFASASTDTLLDSTQTTPKAASFPNDISSRDVPLAEASEDHATIRNEAKSVHQPSIPVVEKNSSSVGKDVAAIAAGAGLASAIGYFASTPRQTPVKSDWMNDLPSAKREQPSADDAHSRGRQVHSDDIPSIPRQPSPVDPVTKDRSSYLLRSSPMSRKDGDENDTLHNIQERDDNGDFATLLELPDDVQTERQRALDTLSTTREEADDPFKSTTEPEIADEFVIKSKKDQKKDKKKAKGLSRFSTQDDLPSSESSRIAEPLPETEWSAPVMVEETPIEEFATSKSKKNKKKDKGLSRSSTQDDLTSFGASQDVLPETVTPMAEPVEESFTSKSKKDKKKDKKKGKSTLAWEDDAPAETSRSIVTDEPSVFSDIQEKVTAPSLEEATIPTTSTDNPSESFSMPKSKKDKKKKKSTLTWEPESVPETSDEPSASISKDLTDEHSTSQRDQGLSEPVVQEPDVEHPTSPLDQIKESSDETSAARLEKGKEKESTAVVEQEARDVLPTEPSAAVKTPKLEEPTPITRDFQETYFDQPVSESDSANELPSVQTIVDSSAPKTKKDKKKRKSLLSWGAWGADTSEPAESSESVVEDSSREVSEPSSSIQNVEQTQAEEPKLEPVEEFSVPKSKKDKKKDKKKKNSITWEPEPEPDEFRDAQEQIQELLPEMPVPRNLLDHQSSSSHEVHLQPEEVPKSREEEQSSLRGQVPVDLPLSRDIEDPSELLIPGAEPEVLSETPLPVQEETESWSSSKNKKDKKKDKKKNKAVLSWPEDNDEIKPVVETSQNAAHTQDNVIDGRETTGLISAGAAAIVGTLTGLVGKRESSPHPSAKTTEPTVETEAPAIPDIPSTRESMIGEDRFHQASEPAAISKDIEEPASSTVEQLHHFDKTQDPLPITSSEIVLTEQAPTDDPLSQEIDQPDTFTPKSKKDKKKDKKKGKSISAWEPEEDQSGSQTPPASFEASRDVSEQPSAVEDSEQVEDFSTPKSKKDKKKDKKKGKAFVSWDETEPVQPVPQEPPAEVSRELNEEIPLAAPIVEPEPEQLVTEDQTAKTSCDLNQERPLATPTVEAEHEFPSFTSKKDKKKDKKKAKATTSWDEPEAQEPASGLSVDTSRNIAEDTPIATPVAEVEDNYPSFISKKDKKKDKKKSKEPSSWEPEPETPLHESVGPETSFEGTGTLDEGSSMPTIEPREAEPGSEVHTQVSSETTDQPDQVPIQEVSTPAPEIEEEFPVFTSKKDKKRAKSATTSEFDESAFPKLTEQSNLEARHDVPETSSASVDDPIINFSTPKSKKDKKKDKKKNRLAAWENDIPEQDVESSQQVVPEPSRDVEEAPPVAADAIASQKMASVADHDPVVTAAQLPETSHDLVRESLPDASTIALPEENGDELRELNIEFPDQNPLTGQAGEWNDNALEKSDNIKSVPIEPDANTRSRELHSEHADQQTEPVLPESSSLETRPNEQIAEPEDFTSDPFAILETIKAKKNKKKGKSKTWEPEEAATSNKVSRDSGTILKDIAPEESMSEEFVTKPSKKDKKKKKGKSTAWEPEEDVSQPIDTSRDIDDASKNVTQEERVPEEFVTKSSKKDKKKKGKSSTAWEPEQETPVSQEPESVADTFADKALETPAEDSYAFAESKKGKKKQGKSVTSWDPELEVATTPAEETPIEPYENSTTPSSKKSKKKSKKSQAWADDDLPPSDSTHDDSKVEEQDTVTPLPDVPSVNPTPMVGPGAWPITPAPPFTASETPREQVPSDAKKSYLPSTSAVLLGAKAVHDKSESESHISKEVERPETLGSSASYPAEIATGPKPATDGFATGYDNDQLSLARQLQEEFGSGSKKSKKDKSKRKSLPVTPARQESRSRANNDLSEDHHRARSLSIEPATARSEVSPGISERPSLYSEDQLELARKLKEEFESGSKKSKKDKKKKPDISQDPVQDEDYTPKVDQTPQHEPSAAAEDQIRSPDALHGDGFAAGYQEDQLSLARQLQAEFGKKSKKDKKRRSTSQTPAEQDPAADYFGETSQRQYTEPQQYEHSQNVPDDVQDKEYTRDGLAVGYNEDQLELARQLKEEFSSGSKKKSKKDKKRQSLLRGTTEDDFSSDGFMAGSEHQSGSATPLDEDARDASLEPEDTFVTGSKKSKKDKKGKKRESSILRETVDADPSDTRAPDVAAEVEDNAAPMFMSNERNVDQPVVVEPEDEFAPVTKKSKKDKKGKKRDSIVPIDEPEPETSFQDTPVPDETPIPESIKADLNENVSAEAENDFAPVSKKGKKDKKSKKRDSLLPAAIGAGAAAIVGTLAGVVGKGQSPGPSTETTEKAIDPESSAQETFATPDNEDFGFSTKKSKEDKKSRKSRAESEDRSTLPETETIREPPTNDVTAANSGTDAIGESDEPKLGRKLSKKEKKRQSLLRSSTLDEPSEEVTDSQHTPKDLTEPVASAPLDEPQDDGFEFSSKKSKEDKKKEKKSRNSTVFENEPMQEDSSSKQQDSVNDRLSEKDPEVTFHEDPKPIDVEPIEAHHVAIDLPSTEQVEEPQDDMFGDFAFTKKSKKDKKKRKDAAKQDFDEASGSSTPMDPGTDLKVDERNLPVEDVSEKKSHEQQPVAAKEPSKLMDRDVVEEPIDEWGSFLTKKSKKDKKRKNLSRAPSEGPSGTSTPLGPVVEPSDKQEVELKTRDLQEPVLPSKFGEASAADNLPLDEIVANQEDDWGSFSTKKSKKDKKKRKSGLSTPIEDSVPATEQHPQETAESSTTTQMLEETTLPREEHPSEQSATLLHESHSIPADHAEESRTLEHAPAHDVEISTLETKDINPEPEDDWAAPKKSNKDKKKRKSGVSTPIEGPVATEFVGEMSTEPNQILLPQDNTPLVGESSSLPPIPVVFDSNTVEPDEDDWAPKKSKKDKKKRKSGVSTPIEEFTAPEPAVETLAEPLSRELTPPATEASTQPPLPADLDSSIVEPEGEWGTLSRKASKKDKKKRKSGLSTPVDESEPVSVGVKDEFIAEPSQIPLPPTVEQESSEREIHDQDLTIPSAPIPGSAEEWEMLRKISKKDKKKRKSGLSTPIEEPASITTSQGVIAESKDPFSLPAVASSTAQRELHEQDSTMPAESSVPEADWENLARKLSKSDKKRLKSGISTPIEQSLIAEPSIPVPIDFEETATRSTQTPEIVNIQTNEPASRSQFLADDKVTSIVEGEPPVSTSRDVQEQEHDGEFAFVSKKSKKDKKGKKASPGNSMGEQGSFVPVGTSGPIDLFPKSAPQEEIPETPEQRTASPVSYEPTTSTRDSHDTDTSRDARFDIHEKRKRQPTVILGGDSGSSTTKAPLTSWADQVEEAEVVRDHPIIEDLAEDETLSHIPSTTESAAVDDFIRPSKKGKKGKKRDSSQSDPVDVPHPPVGADLPRDEPSRKSSDILPAAVLAGAGLAGATLFGHVRESPESPEETSTSGNATPIRKLSKKEKRKQSIDKRIPREDDIFDDPALWEGEKPRAYEDSKHQEDEDDGFWSPPREEEQARETKDTEHSKTPIRDEPAPRENKADVQSYTTPQLFPSFASDAFSKLEDEEPAHKPQDYPTPATPTLELHESDSHHDATGSGESAEGVKSNLESRASQDGTHQGRSTESIARSYKTEKHTCPVTPPEERSISFGHANPFDQEHLSTPKRDHPVLQDLDRSIDSPTDFRQSTPLSSRKYARLSMPVVHEESPESEQHHSSHHYDVPASQRDSAYESPVPPQKGFSDLHEHVRDSGVHLQDPVEKVRTPVASSDDAIARLSWPPVDEETETVDLHRSQRPKSSSKKHYDDGKRSVEVHDTRPKEDKTTDSYRAQRHTEEKPVVHHGEHISGRDTLPSQQVKEETPTDLHRTPTIHGARRNQGSLVQQRLQKFESPGAVQSATPPRAGNIVKQRVQGFQTPDSSRVQRLGPETPELPPPPRPEFETPKSTQSDKSHPSDHESPVYERSQKQDKYAGLTSTERPNAEKPKGFSDLETGVALAGAATLGFAAARKLSQENRPGSAQSIRSSSGGINRLRTPDLHRPDSVNSNRSSTPGLRRSDRKSADLRSLSQRSKPDLAKEAELAAAAASTINTANPTANEGRVRSKDMADVYDGFGEGRMGSPRSPTRPHSMRRRQSMQVLDLENRVEQLAADNRMLAEFKAQAEQNQHESRRSASALVEKDAEIDALKRTLDWLQNEVTRLTEVNEGLNSANAEIARQHSDRYGMLETQHAQATRELHEARDAHTNLTSGVEGMVRNEVQKTVLEKDQQIAQLREELNVAKEKIRAMQREILASKANNIDFLVVRDEDYFDNACQKLCEHVQQWVLRFSKFSDMRACRLTREINNDKTIDRLDNAILDGSDVDIYLADRVKRRDIFMSMTMTMVWEFVFTRYLFGMDREQRQKLKTLEKTLSEVGPASAVHAWRATTLTLLSKREAFQQQREQDTKAVVHAIMETLSEILPPPSNLEPQIEEQLTRVMKAAVDLSIEMRCQRAEYMMLPPLQPEYDANGDLASKVSFNAALMNERSGDTVSNEDLENQKAVVRIVLFPLVVKKGDDSGEGDEEIVVCPAQVLVAKKKTRFTETAQSNHSRMSMQSSMPADVGDNVI